MTDFWDSIQEAREDVRAIVEDLKTLQRVIEDIRRTESAHGVDHIISTVIQSCSQKIAALMILTTEIEPGWRSANWRVRTWTSLKAALKEGKLRKFRDTLRDAKITFSRHVYSMFVLSWLIVLLLRNIVD